MAIQQQDLRAGLQHLANRNQEASATPAVLIHQHQVALVAHLQQQQVLHHRQLGVQNP
jgi:hypothetical protein